MLSKQTDNFQFIEQKKEEITLTRIRCPHCGHETTKIIYGISQMTDQLQRDIDDHKVYLAGCERMIPPPNKVFVIHFSLSKRWKLRKLKFEIGGFHQGYKKLRVENNGNSCDAKYYAPFLSTDEPSKTISLTSDQYKKLVHRIYMTYIKEWDEFYDDPDILDGTSWKITLTCGNYQREWSGNNAYPPLWNHFIKAINSLDLPTIK